MITDQDLKRYLKDRHAFRREQLVLPNGRLYGDVEETWQEEHVDGAGRDDTIIDGNALDRVFDILIRSIVDILGVTVQNGAFGGIQTGGGSWICPAPVLCYNLAATPHLFSLGVAA